MDNDNPKIEFTTTPDSGDGVRIKTISVSLRRKWNLGDYESLDAEASIWADIEPGISNEKLDSVVHRLHAMLRNSTEAMRAGDASADHTNRKRANKTFLGLPIEDQADQTLALPAGEIPAPELISLQIANLLATTNGLMYNELPSEKRTQMIELMGSLTDETLPAGWTRSDVIMRRNALYTLNKAKEESEKGNKTSFNA